MGFEAHPENCSYSQISSQAERILTLLDNDDHINIDKVPFSGLLQTETHRVSVTLYLFFGSIVFAPTRAPLPSLLF